MQYSYMLEIPVFIERPRYINLQEEYIKDEQRCISLTPL